MYFLYPQFLWFLFLLLVPVLLHFFNIRRYKKIYFSDIRLIKQVTQDTQIKSKLKEYIILVERLLALLFLILAFAQPVWKKNKENILLKKNSDVVIYIDNSFSMENISSEGKLLDVALTKVKEIIKMFPKSTKFYILTNDNNNQTLHSLHFDEVEEYLSKIKISSSSLPLSLLYKRINILHLKNPVLFILSDAQKKFTDIQNINDKNFYTQYLLLSPSQINNISIDSVWIDNPVVLPQVPQQLHIKITNHNTENINDLPVKLMINGIQTSILNVSIPAHQSIESLTQFIPQKNNFQLAKVYINDYPVTFDDELYFSINTNTQIKVMLINGSENNESYKYIKSFFQNDSVFVLSECNENQINYSDMMKQDIVVLNELTEFSTGLTEQIKMLCQKGKTIIVIPYIKNNVFKLPPEFQTYQWKIDTSQQNISSDILSHPLFASAFEKNDNTYKMPIVKEHLYSQQSNNFEPIINLNNNHSLLLKYSQQKWNYFLFTSTLNPANNQLSYHSLFVPIMYQLSFTSISKLPLYYYSKSHQNIKIPDIKFDADYSPKIISTNDNNLQFIPGFKNENQTSIINISPQFEILPGQYYLQWKEINIFFFSFNYNRSESDMQFYTQQELEDIIQQYQLNNFKINTITSANVQKILQSEINGQSYWKLCLILCLIFFIAESLTIRLMK